MKLSPSLWNTLESRALPGVTRLLENFQSILLEHDLAELGFTVGKSEKWGGKQQYL